MTVAPAPLAQLVASTRLEELRQAVVAGLKRLLPGVSITAHPGKLDINDVLAKAIVAAPGIAVGWTRVRGSRDLDMGYGLPVEFVAYIVTEDWVLPGSNPPRRVERDVLALAIGAQLLLILADDDTASWGLAGVGMPMADPGPELRPVFTMRSAENRTSVHAVTWTQMLVHQGAPRFGGAAPQVAGLPDGMVFELPDGDLPTELLAALRDGGEP